MTEERLGRMSRAFVKENEDQVPELPERPQSPHPNFVTPRGLALLKQQMAENQLKSVRAQLQFGNGTGSGPGSTPQLTPKAEELARIDESQRAQDALDAGFDLAKARLSLLRALGHMDDWLHELSSR